jgi:hypothetical protein
MVFVGIFALSMVLLAGHPQPVFNMVVTCALYGALRLRDVPRLGLTILSIGIVGAFTIVLTAVQLWTEVQTASEGTRQGGLPYALAATWSLPPENFLTLVVPGFFGSLTHFSYWGAGYLWEMGPFVGLTALSMAILALFGQFPRRVVYMVMAIVLYWIASGDYTPLFAALFRYVPGFDHFRCNSRFIFEAALFLTMLAALGIDGLFRSPRGTKVGAAALIVSALMVAAVGVLLVYDIPFADIVRTRILPGNLHPTTNALHQAGYHCLRSSAIMLPLGAIVLLRRATPSATYLLVAVGVVEMFAFAHSTLTSFSLTDAMPTSVDHFLAAHPGDYRILDMVEFPSDSAVAIDAHDIWGYDSMMLRRYTDFIGYSQGQSSDSWGLYNVAFSQFGRLLALTRLRFVFVQVGLGGRRVIQPLEEGGALPHLQFVNEWTHKVNRDDILSTLSSPTFDPRRTAILEFEPDFLPHSGLADAKAQILERDSDSMLISAQLTKPGLLLITDSYSRYWQALALPQSSQASYQVIPADYAFMAVPLAAGNQLFRLAYRPSGYFVGRWISIGALAIYLLALGIFFAQKRSRQRS